MNPEPQNRSPLIGIAGGMRVAILSLHKGGACGNAQEIGTPCET
jgi:hypothetical protein